jgi:predicted transcriptional regulator
MKEVVESGELKRFMAPRIIEAVGHPFREHALAEFNERIASPTEIGKEVDVDVSLFDHHIQVLEELGCIELVGTRQRRGGKEHFYRAKSTLFFDDERSRKVPRTLRDHLLLSRLQSTVDEAAGAAKAGSLGRPGDEHASWTPARLDNQGWDEAIQVLDEALAQVSKITRTSAERLAERNEQGTAATIGIFGFKTDSTDRVGE